MSQTTSQILAENLKYYTDDVKKRCTSMGDCRYSGETLNLDTDGCFVGRLMPKGLRKRVDEHFGGQDSDLGGVIHDAYLILNYGETFPKIITDNKDLMEDFQALHDCRHFWNDDKGLSSQGTFKLKQILEEYPKTLNKKDFEQFLVD
jgi:hypothetical protein